MCIGATAHVCGSQRTTCGRFSPTTWSWGLNSESHHFLSPITIFMFYSITNMLVFLFFFFSALEEGMNDFIPQSGFASRVFKSQFLKLD